MTWKTSLLLKQSYSSLVIFTLSAFKTYTLKKNKIDMNSYKTMNWFHKLNMVIPKI